MEGGVKERWKERQRDDEQKLEQKLKRDSEEKITLQFVLIVVQNGEWEM